MGNLVIGTAGHVDHGKTALVRALTGMETDTHKEEKERSVSIDIGFAYLELPSGQTVDIIDAPGHEKFVKNMLRGIYGVDGVMLVVAADDGPMPQTVEHLNILQLLEIRKGLIVITKIDLVDSDYLSMVKDEIEQMVKDTFLENARKIYFSAKTGVGLEEVKLALDELAVIKGERDEDKVFRLPVDRVLSVKGYGTVVTGTVASGKIEEGAEVEIYPHGFKTRIRTIQIHQAQVKEARAGQRVGLNLPKVDHREIERGAVVSEREALLSTYIVNARLHYLKSNIEPLFNQQRAKLYTGTSETVCRIILTDREKMFPGDSALVQIRLGRKLAPLPFDRYVLRSLSPVTTIGGGIILETICKKSRSFDVRTERQLKLLESRDFLKVLESLARRSYYRALGIEELSQRSGLTRTRTKEMVDRLVRDRKLVCIGKDQVFHIDNYDRIKAKVLESLGSYYQKNPLVMELSKEELRSRTSPFLDSRVFDRMIHDLSRSKEIEIEGSQIRKLSYQAKLYPHQKAFTNKLNSLINSNQVSPVWRSEIQKVASGMNEKEVEQLLKILAHKGDLVILRDGNIIHPAALRKAKYLIEEEFSRREKLTLAEIRDILGVGRRATQAILEHFDAIGFTVRVGQYRVLRQVLSKNMGKTVEGM